MLEPLFESFRQWTAFYCSFSECSETKRQFFAEFAGTWQVFEILRP